MDPAQPANPDDPAAPPAVADGKRRGLARTIAKTGRGSRAQAEAMVRGGRVKVNGKLVVDPAHPVGPDSVILVDGEPLCEVARCYFAFHKPLRVVTTATEHERRRAMSDFFPPGVPGLRPAGRLDAETSGLVLVSNDAIWNDNAAGGAGFEKEYLVRINGALSEMELDVLSIGMHIPKVGFVKPRSLKVESANDKETTLRVVTLDGKNRQIRRLFSALRHEVLGLHRIRIGPVSLGNLEAGQLRRLTAAEVEQIRAGRGRFRAPARGPEESDAPAPGKVAPVNGTGSPAAPETPATPAAPAAPVAPAPAAPAAPSASPAPAAPAAERPPRRPAARPRGKR